MASAAIAAVVVPVRGSAVVAAMAGSAPRWRRAALVAVWLCGCGSSVDVDSSPDAGPLHEPAPCEDRLDEASCDDLSDVARDEEGRLVWFCTWERVHTFDVSSGNEPECTEGSAAGRCFTFRFGNKAQGCQWNASCGLSAVYRSVGTSVEIMSPDFCDNYEGWEYCKFDYYDVVSIGPDECRCICDLEDGW
jgi:hypothetical protein